MLYVQSEELYQVGRCVGKIIAILSFRVHTSENKNIDHWGKETFAIMSRQVTYDTDHFPLLRDSLMPNELIFLCILL